MWSTNGTKREIRSRLEAMQIHRFGENYKPSKWLTLGTINDSDSRTIRNAQPCTIHSLDI